MRYFDPTTSLLARDIAISSVEVGGMPHKVLKIFLRHPKEEKLSAGVTIDLFQTRGEAGWLCPVTAYKKWRA